MKAQLIILAIIVVSAVVFIAGIVVTQENSVRDEMEVEALRGKNNVSIVSEEKIAPPEDNTTTGKKASDKNCKIERKEMTVRGDSMSPLIPEGKIVKAIFNYYNCEEIKRGDIVLAKYAGNGNLIIKMVRAVPGDKFSLIKEASGGWNIFVNGQALENSQGELYSIDGKKYEMLALYEKDYKGAIPSSAYLLLGDQEVGSVDSTVFGLVDRDSIEAKIEQ